MYNTLIIVVAGLVSGLSSGLLGIGGGVITVPVLILLLGLEPKIAVGTSLFVIVPTALVGMLVHYRVNNIHFSYGFLFLIAAMLGSFIGANLANVFPGYVLRKLFAVLMFIMAIKMFVGK
ncbi:MAG: sulfite exporter TauE/SafE family protein [Candidatus Auribacterota bacterium]|jgi:uncharacterized membrane protein YfcA|nr:sulfite exporter TauE/SafE family protein [Candidatus Auribacterota bacterium]